MKRAAHFVLGFAFGFLAFGYMDRIVQARSDAGFRGESHACMRALMSYSKDLSNPLTPGTSSCKPVVVPVRPVSETIFVRVLCVHYRHEKETVNVLMEDGQVHSYDLSGFIAMLLSNDLAVD